MQLDGYANRSRTSSKGKATRPQTRTQKANTDTEKHTLKPKADWAKSVSECANGQEANNSRTTRNSNKTCHNTQQATVSAYDHKHTLKYIVIMCYIKSHS